MKRPTLTVLALAVVAGAIVLRHTVWSGRSPSLEVPLANTPEPVATAYPTSAVMEASPGLGTGERVHVEASTVAAESSLSDAYSGDELVADRIQPNILESVLPMWMVDDEVDADLRSETLSVAGTTVTRTRGRYQWGAGPFMEVEISDLGPSPSADLLNSMGFNTTLESTNNATGFKIALDTDTALVNHEYEVQDASGSMMLLVRDRLLVEIQIENLPQESFNTILATQLSLERLAALVDSSDLR